MVVGLTRIFSHVPGCYILYVCAGGKSGANIVDGEGCNLSFDTIESNPGQAQETHTSTACNLTASLNSLKMLIFHCCSIMEKSNILIIFYRCYKI